MSEVLKVFVECIEDGREERIPLERELEMPDIGREYVSGEVDSTSVSTICSLSC